MGIYHPKDSKFWWGSFQYSGENRQKGKKGERHHFILSVEYRGRTHDRSQAQAAFYEHIKGIKSKVDQGLEVNRNVTLKDAVDAYISKHAYQKKSLPHDKLILSRFLRYFGETIPLRYIVAAKLEEYRSDRLSTKISKREWNPDLLKYEMKETFVSKPRVNRELDILSSMFSKCVSWGMADFNPVENIKMFPEPRTKERVISDHEEGLILKSCADWLRPIIITALYTGMREGEIFDAKWRDVDFAGQTIFLEDSKSGKSKYIYLNSLMVELLKHTTSRRGPFVFSREDGSQIKNDGKFRFDFERAKLAVMRQGVPPFCFHDFRHTFASRLDEEGIGETTIGRLLGHSQSDRSVTSRYIHTSEKRMMEAVESLIVRKKRLSDRHSVGEVLGAGEGEANTLSVDRQFSDDK